MEGGTELDMTILDQPPSPKPTPKRERSTSERERRTSEMSDKGGAKGSDDKKTDGEEGELKEDDEAKKELVLSNNLHIQIPPDQLRGSHITRYRCGYCKSQYHWGYYEGTLQGLHAQ